MCRISSGGGSFEAAVGVSTTGSMLAAYRDPKQKQEEGAEEWRPNKMFGVPTPAQVRELEASIQTALEVGLGACVRGDSPHRV
jgi:hypothetical protein